MRPRSQTTGLLFNFSNGWALGADHCQWIVLRRRNNRTQTGWKPVSFIASNKTTLRRVLREKGIRLDAKAERQLDALDETFLEWQRNAEAARTGGS